MDNFSLFICGLVVTFIAGIGVITSEVFLGYHKFVKNTIKKTLEKEEEDDIIESIV
jgi:hypothetical protein